MPIKGTQTVSTLNQSTVNIERQNLWLSKNRYQTATFLNNTGAEAVFASGSLVLRDLTASEQIKPAIAGATLVSVIGVLKTNMDGEVTLADAETTPANYCIGGDLDASLLKLPTGVTLATVPTGAAKNLKDILTDLGFVLFNVTEGTKFDN